jgi:tetratricopeptide (TPR) repeat protein
LDYLYYFAHVSRKLGNLEQAETYCKKALKKDKKSRDINFELGIIYQMKGNYMESIKSLQRVLKNTSENVHWLDTVDVLNSLALTHKKGGDFGGGLKYYNLALENLAQNIYENIKAHPLKEAGTQYAGDSQEGWMRLAVQIATKNAAKDGFKKVRIATGETALKFLEQNPLMGIAIHDEDDVRYLLPIYFSAFSSALKSDILYSNMVNNIGTLFAEKGEIEEARKCYMESIEFIPQGVKYDNPFIGLESLQNS